MAVARTSGGSKKPTTTRATPRPSARGRALLQRQLAIQEHAASVDACVACSLHRGRTTPVVGEGPIDARLLVVGLAPRRHEDLQGRAMAGGARNVLDNALRAVGLDPVEVRVTTLLRCRPGGDRAPTADELRACAPHLRREVELVDPEVVVSLGSAATSALLGRPVAIDHVAGYRLGVLEGVTLVPTYHPGDVVRGLPRAAASLSRDLAVATAVLDGRLAAPSA